jgi:ABC-2 type transport system ATP-binding protein
MSAVIEVERVTKRYGDVVAVSDVSFTLEPGVLGLLGPNGAGKTTLLKLMAGLLRPSSGRVTLFGQSLRGHSQLYRRLGYCPEQDQLYDFMAGKEFLEFNASLYGLSNPRQAAEAVLERVALSDQATKAIRAYSRGMRQRLKLAQSLIHNPDVLLLDEPLKGADPSQRRILIELIRQLGESGKTVVVSSHILYEVERMVSQIVLINRGRLVALGDFHAIREAMDDRPHKVLLEVSDPKRLAALLTQSALVSAVNLSDAQLVVDVGDANAFYSKLPQIVVENGVHLRKLSALDEDLESVFRYLVR